MLSNQMESALNKQINAELYSSYLYLSMSTYFEEKNLGGFGHWMRKQSEEEIEHAMKIYKYIYERNGRVSLAGIEEPPSSWDSPVAAITAAYEHEVKVTGMINALVDMAIAEKDHTTNNFLQWFVSEQVEEEDSTRTMVDNLTMIGEQTGPLFMYDAHLKNR